MMLQIRVSDVNCALKGHLSVHAGTPSHTLVAAEMR